MLPLAKRDNVYRIFRRRKIANLWFGDTMTVRSIAGPCSVTRIITVTVKQNGKRRPFVCKKKKKREKLFIYNIIVIFNIDLTLKYLLYRTNARNNNNIFAHACGTRLLDLVRFPSKRPSESIFFFFLFNGVVRLQLLLLFLDFTPNYNMKSVKTIKKKTYRLLKTIAEGISNNPSRTVRVRRSVGFQLN